MGLHGTVTIVNMVMVNAMSFNIDNAVELETQAIKQFQSDLKV